MSSYDLHPLQYKNYINAGGIIQHGAALKIQRVWRKYILNKNYIKNIGVTQNGAALKIQKVWKKYILNKNKKSIPERFFSWFGF
jgi:hypothetical protein